jgi:hypothetical protein
VTVLEFADRDDVAAAKKKPAKKKRPAALAKICSCENA